jgi:hypothetical protein
MGIFSRKEQWERTFRLRSQQGAARGLLTVLFWFWGGIGLLFNVGSLMGLTGSIGVGTSAYLAATALDLDRRHGIVRHGCPAFPQRFRL